MQSWLGACVIAGCAIGATGIVIHHYAKQPCPEQEVTYMISYDEWGKGIIKEFNRAIEKTEYKSREWEDTDSAWNNTANQVTETTRHKCVNEFADLYSKKYQDEGRDKSQPLVIAQTDLLSHVKSECLINKEPAASV